MQRIRQFLADQNMTQREMALRMGISEEHLSRVLNEKTPLSASFIGDFAAVFGFESAQRVFGNEQHIPVPCEEQPA